MIKCTDFGRLEDNLNFVKDLPVQVLHVDLDRAPQQLSSTLSALKSTNLKVSLGVVSGRNIWKSDFVKVFKEIDQAVKELGDKRIVVATSSSLLHTPVTLANENKLTAEQNDWFSFATEKCYEVSAIAKRDEKALEANKKSIGARRSFETNSDKAVRERLAAVTESMYSRQSEFKVRLEAQNKVYQLPNFPTTTIGSFPVRISLFLV